MHRFRSRSSGFSLSILLALSVPPSIAAAETATAPSTAASSAPSAAAPASASTLTGTVKTAGAVPVVGARVELSGPTSATTFTDGSGSFTLSVPQGVYSLRVTKAGYLPGTQSDVAVAGASTVSVTLTTVDLNSLRTIGSVTASSRLGGQINIGAAAQTIISGQSFADLGNPQINDVLQHASDVTIEHMGSQPDTTIIVGGVQPYETQVLIDGHPLALGQYGVWLSQYFPSYGVGAIETQSGPGNTTPFANLAVGGTANILTPSFTTKPTGEFELGIDNYATPYSHLLTTGSIEKAQYVIGFGVDGTNGPYFGTKKCIVVPEQGGALDNTGAQAGVIQTCLNASGSFFNKGEILKARYNFSPSTSFDIGYIGAFGGYQPQGTAWGTSLGPTKIESCLQSNPQQCTNPNFAGMTGQTIDGYGWYTGSTVYTNQTLYDAQLRTTLGGTTFLVRPYIAQIAPENILGGGEVLYPSFYGPAGSAANTTSTDPNSPYNQFAAACGNAFGQTTNPQGGLTVTNGQPECYNSLYQTYEIDKLYGSTFSVVQPFGDSLLNLTYDFHGQSTFAYINNPSGISVPFSTDHYSTFSLTGDIKVAQNLSLKTGLYDTLWSVVGVQPASAADPTLVGFKRTISHFDPHFALVYRPHNGLAYRAAWGTSTTFPFVGQVSGNATYEQPAASLPPQYALGGILTEKNPSLNPEVSTSYELGADARLPDGSVVSLDLQRSVIHNVFESLTSTIANPTNGQPEGVFSPVNVARLNSSLVLLKYAKVPQRGLGYSLSAAAERSIPSGIPASLYSAGSASFPANNVQICGNGTQNPGIPTCIPYLKGYGNINYRFADGSYVGVGGDFEGKNNAYYQPPFWQVDLTARRSVTPTLEFAVGVQNLLNTNNYGTYLATPNAGTPVTAGTLDASGNLAQTSFIATRISAPARTIRVSMRLHTPK
jgi:outer membrane receptor protein involved in Fe transport